MAYHRPLSKIRTSLFEQHNDLFLKLVNHGTALHLSSSIEHGWCTLVCLCCEQWAEPNQWSLIIPNVSLFVFSQLSWYKIRISTCQYYHVRTNGRQFEDGLKHGRWCNTHSLRTAKSPSKYFIWCMTQTLQTFTCLLLEVRLLRQGSRSVQLMYYTQDLTETLRDKHISRLQCCWIFAWGKSYPWQFIYIIIREYNWSLPHSLKSS